MLKEKMVTNNEYQKILEKEASLYWKKVFAIPENKRDQLEQLKKQYWQEMDKELEKYKITKFDPGLQNEKLNSFIETYCNNNEVTEDYTRYNGYIGSEYITIEGCNNIVNTGYSQYLICESDLTTVSYCEGDITVIVYNNKKAYNYGIEKSIEFYKNN